jgi:hypothetical protein
MSTIASIWFVVGYALLLTLAITVALYFTNPDRKKRK